MQWPIQIKIQLIITHQATDIDPVRDIDLNMFEMINIKIYSLLDEIELFWHLTVCV